MKTKRLHADNNTTNSPPHNPEEQALRRQKDALQALNDIAALPELDPQRQLSEAIALGARFLEAHVGIVAQIDVAQSQYKIISRFVIDKNQVSPEIAEKLGPMYDLQDGQILSLQDTYCQYLGGEHSVLAVDDVMQSFFQEKHCYTLYPLTTYLGTQIKVEGAAFGVVCFVNVFERKEKFSDAEIDFLRLLSRWIGAALSRSAALLRVIESEEKYRSLVAAMVEGVVLQDEQGRILSHNQSAERILGLTADQLVGRDSFDPRWRAVRADGSPFPGKEHPAMRTLATRSPSSDVMGVHLPNGNLHWISVSSQPLELPRHESALLYGADKYEHAAVTTFHDITQSVEATEKLRFANAKLAGILDAIPDVLVYLDAEERFESAHWGADPRAALFEMAFQQMLFGKKVSEINYYIKDSLQKALAEARRGQMCIFEHEYKGTLFKDGFWEVRVLCVETGGFLIVARDITERKQIEQLKNNFISTVSHELRTPLTAIRGALGTLVVQIQNYAQKQKSRENNPKIKPETKPDLSADLDKLLNLLQISYKNSVRLGEIVNDILDEEQMSMGKMIFTPKLCRVADLLKQTTDLMSSYADKFGVVISIDVSSHLQNMLWIEVDENRFLQVMSNLLSNAVKYAPPKSVVSISVEKQAPAHIVIAVTDKGAGIPVAFRERIFERFSRADDSNARGVGGSGLGLHITKFLVEKMGGEISFRSICAEELAAQDTNASTTGTTFWVRFPQAHDATDTNFDTNHTHDERT